jgi:hypothetical protein
LGGGGEGGGGGGGVGGEFDFTLNLCGKKNPRERFLERERTLQKDSTFDNKELVAYGKISRLDNKISIISW